MATDTLAKLVVMMEADSARLQKGIEQANNRISRFERNTKKSFKTLKDTTNATFSGIAKKIAAIAVPVGLGALAHSFIQASSTAEQYQIRLSALLGSQKEGNRLFQEMTKYASKVPFEYQDIMGAATQLAGVLSGGVDEIKQWMPLIGDLAAVSGLSIQQTTDQVSRMLSAGAASADTFAQRGINSMLGFTAGVHYSVEDTRKQLMYQWTKMGSQFKGAADKLGMTWSGLMSMFSDLWFKFRIGIMKEGGLFNYFKSIAMVLKDNLTSALRGNQKAYKTWGDIAITVMNNIIRAIGYVADAFQLLKIVWTTLKVAFYGLMTSIFEKLQDFDIVITEILKKMHFDAKPSDSILIWAATARAELENTKAILADILEGNFPHTKVNEFLDAVEIKLQKLEAQANKTKNAVGGGNQGELYKGILNNKPLKFQAEDEATRNERFQKIQTERLLKAQKYRADQEKKIELAKNQIIMNSREGVMNASVQLLQQFAGKSKAAAIATIAIERAIDIARAIMATHLAAAKALVIDPTGRLSARVEAMGYVQVGLIAATGLAQIAALNSNNNASGGGGAALGSAANPINVTSPQLPQAQTSTNQTGTTYIYVDAKTHSIDDIATGLQTKFDNGSYVMIKSNTPQALEIAKAVRNLP